MPPIRSLLALALGVAMASSPALAHHSYSAFDRTEAAKRHLIGTVREFTLINPHGWLKLDVVEPGGKTGVWTLELSSAAQLRRVGWSITTIKYGDKVDVTYFPLRFGSYGGQLVAIRLPDGHQLQGTAEADRGYPGQGK